MELEKYIKEIVRRETLNIKKSRYLLDDFSKKLLRNCMNNTFLKKNKINGDRK